MDENNSNLPQDEKSNSRRRFISRASAGAVLATLPSKSVWATMSSNSIAASGHGSDFAGGAHLQLKKPHDWLKTGVGQLAYKYYSVCGGNPKIHWKLSRCIGHKADKLFLCHLLGDVGELTHFFKSIGGEVKVFKRSGKTYHVKLWDSRKQRNRYFTWNNIFKYIGGDSELNKYIVSTYLNAKLSGIYAGVVYPIANSYNGSRPPFTSAEAFIKKIHQSASHDPDGTLELLKTLHHNPNSLRTYGA
jgi:hypothetical protein